MLIDPKTHSGQEELDRWQMAMEFMVHEGKTQKYLPVWVTCDGCGERGMLFVPVPEVIAIPHAGNVACDCGHRIGYVTRLMPDGTLSTTIYQEPEIRFRSDR